MRSNGAARIMYNGGVAILGRRKSAGFKRCASDPSHAYLPLPDVPSRFNFHLWRTREMSGNLILRRSDLTTATLRWPPPASPISPVPGPFSFADCSCSTAAFFADPNEKVSG